LKYILGSFEFIIEWMAFKTKTKLKSDLKTKDAIKNRLMSIKFATNCISNTTINSFNNIIDFEYINETYDFLYLIDDNNFISVLFPFERKHKINFLFNEFEYLLKLKTGAKNLTNKNNDATYISDYSSRKVKDTNSIWTVKK